MASEPPCMALAHTALRGNNFVIVYSTRAHHSKRYIDSAFPTSPPRARHAQCNNKASDASPAAAHVLASGARARGPRRARGFLPQLAAAAGAGPLRRLGRLQGLRRSVLGLADGSGLAGRGASAPMCGRPDEGSAE